MNTVNHFSIRITAQSLPLVAVYTKEHALGELYARHLQNLPAQTSLFTDPEELVSSLFKKQPRVIIFDVGTAEMVYTKVKFLSGISKRFPLIPLVTTGLAITETGLTDLMRTGVSGHIERTLTKPRDIVALVEHHLIKNV